MTNKPFRFEAAWMEHPQYHQVVAEAWSKGTPWLSASLNHVQEDSIAFNINVFGNIFKRKRMVAARIASTQQRLEQVDYAFLARRLQDLRREQEDILAQEEMLWYQKSREKWVKFGDRNTAFFHAQTVIRRRPNHIQGLTLEDGNWCTGGW